MSSTGSKFTEEGGGIVIGPVDRKISKKETMLWARLHGETFAFAIKAKTVPAILEVMDGYAKEQDITEQSAMEDAVEVLEGGWNGSEDEQDATMYAIHCLLWAACRCPAGKTAEKAARKGGESVGFDIGQLDSDGNFTYGLHVGGLTCVHALPAGHA